MIYERLRHPDRPWGYWLLRRGHHVYDEGDRAFASVRHAFWSGRLGMPDREPGGYGGASPRERLIDVELERIAAYLASLDRSSADPQRWRHPEDMDAFRKAWLAGQGIVEGDTLTVEGRAVLRMLAATNAPRHAALATEDGPIPSPEDTDCRAREAWFRRVASVTADRRFRFERRDVGLHDGIELVADGVGEELERAVRLNMGRVIWSQNFSDEACRDRFHHWLCLHLDLWDDWGQRAWLRGAPHLTHHLLDVVSRTMIGRGRILAAILRPGNGTVAED